MSPLRRGPSSTSPTTTRLRSAFESLEPRAGLQLRGLPQRRGVRDRGGPLLRGQRACGQAARPAVRGDRRAARPRRARTTSSTARAERAVRRARRAQSAERLRDLEACRRVRRAWRTATARWSSAPPASTARTAARQRAATSSRGWSLAPARTAPSFGWSPTSACSPTFTADLAAALLDAVEREATGIVHLTSSRRVLMARVHGRDHAARRDGSSRSRPSRRRSRPAARTVRSTACWARPRADELGLPSLRHWQRRARGLHAASRPRGRRSALVAERQHVLDVAQQRGGASRCGRLQVESAGPLDAHVGIVVLDPMLSLVRRSTSRSCTSRRRGRSSRRIRARTRSGRTADACA